MYAVNQRSCFQVDSHAPGPDTFPHFSAERCYAGNESE